MNTTYTIKGRKAAFLWQFKYTLNGDLLSFKVLDGTLNNVQMHWLFSPRFPATEKIMKDIWMKNFRKNFEITVGEPDLSFSAFWNSYALKIGKKKMAENSWNKLSKGNKIKALMGIKKYDNNLRLHPGVQKAHASTYLNQEYYNNEY